MSWKYRSLLAILVFINITLFWRSCEDPAPIRIRIKHDTIEIIKDSIIVREKEVVKWKAQKDKIIYRTLFDTLATIDTVIVELIKCDSIVNIDSLIIANQDTIIQQQTEMIGLEEAEIDNLNKDLKKEKRKLLISKVIAVVGLLLTLILVK